MKNQDELKHDLEFSNQELNVLEAELCLGKNFTSKKSFLEVVINQLSVVVQVVLNR